MESPIIRPDTNSEKDEPPIDDRDRKANRIASNIRNTLNESWEFFLHTWKKWNMQALKEKYPFAIYYALSFTKNLI